jgi:enoyl-CoA hydratase/carnithine racemase
MSEPAVVISAESSALHTRINRPRALNAIDEQVLDGLEAALSQVAADHSLRALVITGTDEVFCVGMDIECIGRGMGDHGYFRSFIARLKSILAAIETCEVPVIAAVNGLTRAGGLELLLSCDLAVAAVDARIGDNHTAFGILPGAGTTQRAPRRIGLMRALDLVLTGRFLDGAEAARWGLVLEAVPRDEIGESVEQLVAQFRDKSRACLALAKRATRAAATLPPEAGHALEEELFFRHLETCPDSREGYDAYREHRSPVWRS